MDQAQATPAPANGAEAAAVAAAGSTPNIASAPAPEVTDNGAAEASAASASPSWEDLVSSVFADDAPAPNQGEHKRSASSGGSERQPQAAESRRGGNAAAELDKPTEGAAADPNAVPVVTEGTSERPTEIMVPTPSGEWRKATPDELIKWQNQARYASGADERFIEARQLREEAAAAKAEAEALRKQMLENPWDVLQSQGVDADKLVQQRLLEQYQLAEMDDETRAIYLENKRLKEEQQQLAKQRSAFEAAQTQRQRAAEAQHFRDHVMPRIKANFEKQGVPDVPLAHQMMAQKLRQARDAGVSIQEMDPGMFADRVAAELRETVRKSLANVSGNELLQLLGKDVVNAINQALVSEYKARQQRVRHVPQAEPQTQSGVVDRRKAKPKGTKQLTAKQWKAIERGKATYNDFL